MVSDSVQARVDVLANMLVEIKTLHFSRGRAVKRHHFPLHEFVQHIVGLNDSGSGGVSDGGDSESDSDSDSDSDRDS